MWWRAPAATGGGPSNHTDFFFAASFNDARTWIGRPIRLMKPRASRWSYSAPIVKLAMLSEYSEYGDFRHAGWILPLRRRSVISPVVVFDASLKNSSSDSRSGVNHRPL